MAILDEFRPRLGRQGRCLMLAGAVGFMTVLAVARGLTPDPRGFGTHGQLGLKACPFATVTRRLCPTCGMTTAFAWFVRGGLARSWSANPAGLVLAIFSVAFVPWLLGSAALDTPIGFRSAATPFLGALVIAVVLSLAIWWARLIISPSSLTVPDSTSAGVIGAPGLGITQGRRG